MPNAIHFAAGMADSPSRLPMHLIYFSFMTVTTVGYGDACPVHPAARSLAMTGRLYIAIMIASLVGAALTRVNFSPGTVCAK